MLLNAANRIVDTLRVSQGGTTSTLVDVKLLLKPAVLQQAASLMLFHNHPSGNCFPSKADDALTQKIKSAAQLLDIRVLDHIIVTDRAYYSYADEGKL